MRDMKLLLYVLHAHDLRIIMENTGGKNEICTNELSLFEIFAEEIPGQGRTVSI